MHHMSASAHSTCGRIERTVVNMLGMIVRGSAVTSWLSNKRATAARRPLWRLGTPPRLVWQPLGTIELLQKIRVLRRLHRAPGASVRYVDGGFAPAACCPGLRRGRCVLRAHACQKLWIAGCAARRLGTGHSEPVDAPSSACQ